MGMMKSVTVKNIFLQLVSKLDKYQKFIFLIISLFINLLILYPHFYIVLLHVLFCFINNVITFYF